MRTVVTFVYLWGKGARESGRAREWAGGGSGSGGRGKGAGGAGGGAVEQAAAVAAFFYRRGKEQGE